MSRGYVINGECLVLVKLGPTTTLGTNLPATLWELGLAVEGIKISPRWKHKDIIVDDFGPNIPAETMWQLADVLINMTLVHYDPTVLEFVIDNSMAVTGGGVSGTMTGAGTVMGGGVPVLSAGNNYISLNLTSPVQGKPWRFPTSYLSEQPVMLPLGTTRTMPQLVWRAIPYCPLGVGPTGNGMPVVARNEILSAGRVLWDHTLDTGTPENEPEEDDDDDWLEGIINYIGQT